MPAARWLSPSGASSASTAWPFGWYTAAELHWKNATTSWQRSISAAEPSPLAAMSVAKSLVRATAKLRT